MPTWRTHVSAEHPKREQRRHEAHSAPATRRPVVSSRCPWGEPHGHRLPRGLGGGPCKTDSEQLPLGRAGQGGGGGRLLQPRFPPALPSPPTPGTGRGAAEDGDGEHPPGCCSADPEQKCRDLRQHSTRHRGSPALALLSPLPEYSALPWLLSPPPPLRVPSCPEAPTPPPALPRWCGEAQGPAWRPAEGWEEGAQSTALPLLWPRRGRVPLPDPSAPALPLYVRTGSLPSRWPGREGHRARKG